MIKKSMGHRARWDTDFGLLPQNFGLTHAPGLKAVKPIFNDLKQSVMPYRATMVPTDLGD